MTRRAEAEPRQRCDPTKDALRPSALLPATRASSPDAFPETEAPTVKVGVEVIRDLPPPCWRPMADHRLLLLPQRAADPHEGCMGPRSCLLASTEPGATAPG